MWTSLQTLPRTLHSSGGQRRRLLFRESRNEVCESRGSRPGLPVPNKPRGFCERKTTLNQIKCLLGNSSDGEVQGRWYLVLKLSVIGVNLLTLFLVQNYGWQVLPI